MTEIFFRMCQLWFSIHQLEEEKKRFWSGSVKTLMFENAAACCKARRQSNLHGNGHLF